MEILRREDQCLLAQPCRYPIGVNLLEDPEFIRECEEIRRQREEGTYWDGYEFKNLYGSECISKSKADLNEIVLDYNSETETVVFKHNIFYNPQFNKYMVTLCYYIKIPKSGLTLFNLFKQIDEQSKKYYDQYWYVKDNKYYGDDHRYIEHIVKNTDGQYTLCCGS